MAILRRAAHDPDRTRKFRQAAIVYLHYGVLYLVGARVLVERDLFPATRGPEWLWFGAGTLILALVVTALWWWQNAWFARALWLLVALRLPTLVEGTFFGGPNGDVPQGLYLAAAAAVLVNLWALARAAWDV